MSTDNARSTNIGSNLRWTNIAKWKNIAKSTNMKRSTCFTLTVKCGESRKSQFSMRRSREPSRFAESLSPFFVYMYHHGFATICEGKTWSCYHERRKGGVYPFPFEDNQSQECPTCPYITHI